jgi:hypothetical protein
MKTKQVNKKQTVRCSHNKDYQYRRWHIVTKENNVIELDEYVNEFAEYDYDLCDICENTEVNGLAVNAWITIEETLVWGVTVFKSRVIEATEMMNEKPSQEKRLEHTRNDAYHKMVRYQDIIKMIRRSMVSGISGE